MTQKEKPKKPYPDFPLTPHPTGQWCKKIRGKIHYFGRDADAALSKYQEERDDLQAGRKPRLQQSSLTLRELVNQFLTAKKRLIASSELAPRTWKDYFDVCEKLIDSFGKERSVADLRPDDFETLRAKLAKTLGPVSISSFILRASVVFNWALDNELTDKPVRFGTSFKRPSAKVLRKARADGGSRMIEAHELRKIVEAAKQPIKAMILLGANCGYGFGLRRPSPRRHRFQKRMDRLPSAEDWHPPPLSFMAGDNRRPKRSNRATAESKGRIRCRPSVRH